MICNKCGFKFEGNFCSQCGESVFTKESDNSKNIQESPIPADFKDLKRLALILSVTFIPFWFLTVVIGSGVVFYGVFVFLAEVLMIVMAKTTGEKLVRKMAKDNNHRLVYLLCILTSCILCLIPVILAVIAELSKN